MRGIHQLSRMGFIVLIISQFVLPIQAFNQTPEVISLYTQEKVYQAGEPLELDYFYLNEKGEKVEETWTYRRLGEFPNQKLYTKPEAIFREGKYIVTLRLKDEKGNVGETKECVVKVKGKPQQSEYAYKFGKVPIGTTLDNFEEVNYREYDRVEKMAQKNKIPGTLIMSNSPETVKREGILYEESVSGKGRLLVHHVNKIKGEGKSLIVLAKNQSGKRISLKVTNKSFKGPSKDILAIGQDVLYDYFRGLKGEHLHLEKDEIGILYDSSKDKWKEEEVISGMLDFETEGCIKYIVAAVSQNWQIEEILMLERVPRDVHPRGTFESLAKYYDIRLNEPGKNTKLVIGENEGEWEKGRDTLTNKTCLNRGNFGVNYHLNITASEDTAVILNPRGNMFRGAIAWKDEGAYLVPKDGYFPSLEKAAYLGVIKAGETKELVYMLPCGSSAPIVIGFIPKRNW